jgi:glycosyltransferase involved in cell wall biosynthesis
VSGSAQGRPRLAILTNILAPYRLPIFECAADHFEVTVLYSGEESNRGEWRGLERAVRGIQVKRTMGFVFAWTRRREARALETRYLHVNPGLISDLLRLRPAAIVTSEMGFRTLIALTYGWIFRRPVWVWWGGTSHTERGIGAARRLIRRLLVPVIRRWFSYGLTSTEYLVSLGVDPGRVVELQNCVAENRYREPVPPAFQLEPKPVLLCVGRLVPGKGVDLLLHAAARLQAEGRTFSLLVVGDGPERHALELLVADLGLRHVHFAPACAPDAMPAIYRSGDALVFPTLDDVWGLVVNEALWSGLPALVSIYAGCARELVTAKGTVDPLDPADFTAKLRLAVTGGLPRPDLTRLMRIDEVGARMVRELQASLQDTSTGPSQEQAAPSSPAMAVRHSPLRHRKAEPPPPVG